MLLDHWFDQTQRIECSVFEISLAVHLAMIARIAVASLIGYVLGTVLSGEKASCQRIIDNHIDSISMTTGNELLL